MKKSKLPKTDSVTKLAEFWDRHDVTDFEDELEEVTEPVFVRGAGIRVPLEAREVRAVEKLARAFRSPWYCAMRASPRSAFPTPFGFPNFS